MNIYFSDYSFEARDRPKGLTSLAVVLSITGLMMLQLLVVPSTSTEDIEVKRLIGTVGAMIPSGFFWGLTFMTLGQVAHLFAFEKKAAKQFTLKNFDLRLKWRHDYVKYHLPTPIRKLNLRLFNQHVEAYERYLDSQP
ncbi:MAG TPA: hypothetical protein VFV39_11005 [Limnobacter sp.]|nr:hypothetical protein [Limnobacter sp.]